jgi:hypothetical protein
MANNQLNYSPDRAPSRHLQASNEPLNAPDLPASGSNSGRSQLGVDYQPSRFSVICGRGKGSYNHAGNHNFRELAKKSLKRYSRARSKPDRLDVFAHMVDTIHQAGGIFCMFEKGAWFEVGDLCAREKASALLRDMRFKHRSSAKAKLKPVCRRTQKQEKTLPQIQQYSQLALPQIQQYSQLALPRNQQYSQLALPYSQLPLPLVNQYNQFTRPLNHQYVQQPVGGTGHSDDTTQTRQYVQQLIDGTTGKWDDSLGLGSSKDLLEFENSLEYEDDFFDVFKIDSLHATRFTPSTPSA